MPTSQCPGAPPRGPRCTRRDWGQRDPGFAAARSQGPREEVFRAPGLPARVTARGLSLRGVGVRALQAPASLWCGAWASGFLCGVRLWPIHPAVAREPSALGGGHPFPSPSGDNGGRGLGLSKAQVSGNVSVLRAPGTDRHQAPLRGGPGGRCGRRGEEARLEHRPGAPRAVRCLCHFHVFGLPPCHPRPRVG